jgi:hypothetical protein
MNLALILFIIFTLIVSLFQLALALGAPWGKIAMAGKYPGKFPNKMRIAAVFQMFILLFFIWIALVKSEKLNLDWKGFADKMIWVVVSFSLIASVLNIITPSRWERIIWAPVCLIMLITSILIAIN